MVLNASKQQSSVRFSVLNKLISGSTTGTKIWNPGFACEIVTGQKKRDLLKRPLSKLVNAYYSLN